MHEDAETTLKITKYVQSPDYSTRESEDKRQVCALKGKHAYHMSVYTQ